MNADKEESKAKKRRLNNSLLENVEFTNTSMDLRNRTTVKSKQYWPCVICELEFTSDELINHVNNELIWLREYSKKLYQRELHKSEKCLPKQQITEHEVESKSTNDISSNSPIDNNVISTKEERKNIIDIIKKNRRKRVRGAARCPVCFKAIPGEQIEVQDHVDSCLDNSIQRRQNENGLIDIDSFSSDDNNEEFEEYTWCGQTRVRATSGLHSQVLGSLATVGRMISPEEDVDVNVVETEENVFGDAQYNENDIIVSNKSKKTETNETLALRSAVGNSMIVPENRKRWENNKIIINETHDIKKCSETNNRIDNKNIVVKHDISSMENLNKLQCLTPQCLICMDQYNTPAVSIQCWHVFCEECWLRTLGSKKVCPKCNEITSPSHLRKIFI